MAFLFHGLFTLASGRWMSAMGAQLCVLALVLVPVQGMAQTGLSVGNADLDVPDFGFDLIILQEGPEPVPVALDRTKQLSVAQVMAAGPSPLLRDKHIDWLAALTPSSKARDLAANAARIIGQDMDAKDLARALQSELQRLGCYMSGIDGDWGKRSRDALEEYLTLTGQSAEGREPMPVLLVMTQASLSRVCPVKVTIPGGGGRGGSGGGRGGPPNEGPVVRDPVDTSRNTESTTGERLRNVIDGLGSR